jgi:hypothetical protein
MKRKAIISNKEIENKIYLIRGQKVMFDKDLAELYHVETRALNQAVLRNTKRFPDDFMFQLSRKEWENLKSQIVISSWGGRRQLPYVFTEHGVLMLSSVLNSKRAVSVNIQIMRIFIKIREMIISSKDILLKLEQLEKGVKNHDGEIKLIFKYLQQLINPPSPPRKRIGYKRSSEQQA